MTDFEQAAIMLAVLVSPILALAVVETLDLIFRKRR